jgi:hypothetical protein
MKKGRSSRRVGWVAANVTSGLYPLDCYVGEVHAVDDQGFRLTLVDWVIGMMAG